MSSIVFATNEWAAAVTRGVQQCVIIGSRLSEALLPVHHPEQSVKIFEVDAGQPVESLATALDKTDFDKLKATLFVWLGGAGYRSMDAAIATLSFIASLPRGSGVVFDYAPERSPLSATQTALDSLASKVFSAGGNFKLLIQPQAVAAMLRGMGFRKINDLSSNNRHLVSALL